MLAHCDIKNSDAMLRLVARRADIQILRASHDRDGLRCRAGAPWAPDLHNEALAKIYASQKRFRDQNYLFRGAADYQYDTSLLTLRRKP